MRSVGVVSVARSDYGLYAPLLSRIKADPKLRLLLYVSGMHLSPEFGKTVEQIENDGYEITDRIESLLSSDSAEGIAKSMGLGALGFAEALARNRPDILVVLGDRFDMIGAALAALPQKIPVVHLFGGEITEGCIDDSLRHCLTKLSHLHCVSTETYGKRVQQLGEESWRVHVTGALSVDNIKHTKLLSAEEFQNRYGIDTARPFLLVTFHPVTLEFERTETHILELLKALSKANQPCVFTLPNADTGGRVIMEKITEFCLNRPDSVVVQNFGLQGYFTAMSFASAMVGNSSSGLVEAPAFQLPAVNVGNRQAGRVRSKNIIDVENQADDIYSAIEKALSEKFRSTLKEMTNPFGNGDAAERIVKLIKEIPLDDKLLLKRFADLD